MMRGPGRRCFCETAQWMSMISLKNRMAGQVPASLLERTTVGYISLGRLYCLSFV